MANSPVATMTARVQIDKKETMDELIKDLNDVQKAADGKAIVYKLKADTNSLLKVLTEIQNSKFELGADIVIESKSDVLQKQINSMMKGLEAPISIDDAAINNVDEEIKTVTKDLSEAKKALKNLTKGSDLNAIKKQLSDVAKELNTGKLTEKAYDKKAKEFLDLIETYKQLGGKLSQSTEDLYEYLEDFYSKYKAKSLVADPAEIAKQEKLIEDLSGKLEELKAKKKDVADTPVVKQGPSPTDTVSSSTDTLQNEEAAFEKVGEAAKEAAQKKDVFTEANKQAAASAEKLVDASSKGLFEDSSGQLSFVENLTSAEQKLSAAMEKVSEEAKESSEQIEGQLSLDFSNATQGQEKYELAIANTNDELRRMADLAFHADTTNAIDVFANQMQVLKAQAAEEERLVIEAAQRTAEIQQQNAELEQQKELIRGAAETAFRMDTGQTGSNQYMQMLQASYRLIQQEVNELVRATQAQMEQVSLANRFGDAIVEFTDDLVKANVESSGLSESLKEAIDITKKAEAGSSTDTLENLHAYEAELAAMYKEAESQRERVIKKTDAINEAIIDAENKRRKAAEAAAEKQQQAEKEEQQAAEETISSLAKKAEAYTNASTYAKEINDRAEALIQTFRELSKQDIINEDDIKNAREELLKLQADASKDTGKAVNPQKLENVLNQIDKYEKKYTGLSTKTKNALDEVRIAMEKAPNNAEYKELWRTFLRIQRTARDAGEEAQSMFTTIGNRWKDMNAKFIAQFFSFQDILRYVKELAANVVALDSALTELRKVSDASTERLQQSFEKSAQSAQELGSTISDVINITSDWARLGYNVDQAEELARVTTLFKTVGDNMSADDASSYLVSTMQGFQIAADQAEDIVDKYNEVANNFAIDTTGIGQALQRSAASFNAANTDLSKSIALITATNEVVQNPESVGTLWKTMSARIRGAKTELEDLNEETDEYTETTSKLRDLVMGLTGFDIMEDKDTFKDIYEIIMGIGKEWDKLTDIERASLGEALAGKRNANALYAVLGNLDTLEEAYEAAEDAAGSAAKEQENYAKSVQYSIDRFKASVEELSYDFLNSDLLKGIVEFGNTLIRILDYVVENRAVLVLLTTALGAGIFAKNKSKILDNLDSLLGFITNLTGGVSLFTQTIDPATLSLSEFMKLVSAGGKVNDSTGLMTIPGILAKIPGPAKVAAGAVAAVTAAVIATKKANEELRRSAEELGKQYAESESDIDGYKTKIEDLYGIINDETSSYEDSKKAREDLLGIQDELIEKYGKESKSIKDVTDAINGQIDALDRLTDKQWAETLNEFNEQNLKGWDWMNRLTHDASDNIGVMLKDMEEYSTILSFGSNTEFTKLVQSLYGGNLKYDSGRLIGLELTGALDDVYDKILSIQQLARDEGLSDSLLSGLGKQASDAKELLDQYSQFYNQYVLNERVFGTEYEDTYSSLAEQYAKYKKAIIEDDKLAAEQYKQEMLDAYSEIYSSMTEDGISTEELSVWKALKGVVPEFQNELDSHVFTVYLQTDDEQVKKETEEIAEAIKQFGSAEELLAYGAIDSEDNPLHEFYQKIEQYADAHKVTIEELIKLYAELKKLGNFDMRNPYESYSRFERVNGLQQYDERGVKLNNPNGVNAISQADHNAAIANLSDEDYEIYKNMSDEQLTQVYNDLEKIRKSTKGNISDAQAFEKAVGNVVAKIKEAKDEADELNATFDNAKFVETDDDLEKLQSLYEKFRSNVENDQIKVPLDISDVEALPETWKNLEGFKDFELKVTTSTNVDEVQKAFDDFATDYARNSIKIQGLTKETMDMVKAQMKMDGLEEGGVNKLVDSLAAEEKMNEFVDALEKGADAEGNMEDSALDSAVAIYEEAKALGISDDMLVDYLKEAALAGNIVIDGDEAWLYTLADALDMDIAKLRELLGLAQQGSGYATSYDSEGNKHITSTYMPNGTNAKDWAAQQQQWRNEEKWRNITNALTSPSKTSGGGSGSSEDPYIKAYEEELKKLQALRDRGEISEKQYLDNLKALIDKFFKDRTKYAEKYASEMYSYLEGMKSLYESALSGVTTLLGKKMDAAEKGKDAAISALEAERDAAAEYYQDQIDYIDDLIDSLEDEKDAIQDQIDVLQDQIDAINDANTAREHAMALQKAQYELQRSMNQRTRLVYTGEPGQMIYERDEKAVREAQEGVRDAEDQLAIDKIENQIKLLEKQQELIDNQIESYKDQQEALQKLLDQSNEYYENLISETEAYWDSVIDSLEEQKTKWEELAEIETIAKAYASVQEVMEGLGYTVEDVLNDTPGAFEAFKDSYLGILTDMNSGNQPFLDGLAYATDQAKDSFGQISDSAGDTKEAMEKIAEATAPLSEAAGNITAVGSAAQGASSGVAALKTATDGISENLTELNENALSGFQTAVSNAQEDVQKLVDLISGDNGIVGAINKLNDPELLAAIGKSFESLGTAITSVATALGISSGGGNGDSEDPAASRSESMSEGANGKDFGGGEGLVGAIAEIKNATDTYIGTNAEAEGKTAIGSFVAMKTSVDNVSTAIGQGGENDTGAEDGTLTAAITSLKETTANTLVGKGEDGVIGLFNELAEAIDACATAADELVRSIEKLSGMTIPALPDVPTDYTGTAHPHFEGTAKLSGDWGVRNGGRTLMGELGQELVIRDGKFFTVGDDGPGFYNLQRGDVVLNHLQTREILNKKNLILPKGSRVLASGTVLSPVSGRNLGGITSTLPAFSEIRKVVAEQTKEIQNSLEKVGTRIDTKPGVVINNPSFTVSGVTGEEVMRQIEGSFEGLMLNAYQKAMR